MSLLNLFSIGIIVTVAPPLILTALETTDEGFVGDVTEVEDLDTVGFDESEFGVSIFFIVIAIKKSRFLIFGGNIRVSVDRIVITRYF